MINLMISFNAVMPMFLLILLGLMLKKKCQLDEKTSLQMNKIVFQILIPALIFNNIYKTNIKTIFKPELILFTVFAILGIWALSIFFVTLAEKRPSKRGAMIQGIFRSNFTLFGLPIVTNLFGTAEIGITSLMISVVIPVFNVLAVITLETFRGGAFKLFKVLFEIIRNPLMISSALGIFVLAANVHLPVFLETTVSNIANIATPLALIIMGASLKIECTKENSKNLMITVISKLVAAPALTLPIAVLMGFKGIELATLLAIFASPTAIVSFVMAEQMGSDGDLAAEIVVFTTLISCLTIFLWIFGLKQFDLI